MEMDEKIYSEHADFLKALAHPLRLCIVRGLMEKNGCNGTYMQKCLNAPQSTISQQLQKLRAAGIVEGTRNGLEINYRVCDPRAVEIIHTLFDEKEEKN